MKAVRSRAKAASIASVTDQVRPLALGMPVSSVHFLGETRRLRRRRGECRRSSAPTARSRKSTIHGGGILCAASDGERIVTGGDDGKLVALNAKGEISVLATDAKRRWIDNVALHPDGAVAWSAGKTAFVPQRQGRGEILRRALDRRRAGVCAKGPAAGGRALQRRDAVVSQHGGASRNSWNGRARISASPSARTTTSWSPRCMSRRCMAGGSPTTGTCA